MNKSTQFPPQEIWFKFIESFKRNIAIAKPAIVKNYAKMTSYYKDDLFPKIANDLGLKSEDREYLRLDIMLYAGERYHVPIIFVESENDATGELENEIHKLLSVNASLKVLMTRASLAVDIEKRYNGHADTYWYFPLQDFAEFRRLVGYFVMMAAEWIDNSQVYKYVVYDETGHSINGIQEIS